MRIRKIFFAMANTRFSRGISMAIIFAICISTFSYAQQALPKIETDSLKKIAQETSNIESLIIMATPKSLAAARAEIDTAPYLSSPDRAALMAITRGVWAILYGPKDARAEISAEAQGATTKYLACLAGLVDASMGKNPRVLENFTCSAMTELVLSLPFFRSTSNEVRNSALTAVTTFKSFGQESAVPLLIEGQLAFETKNFSESAASYARALAMDPQSQKAACGLAKATMEMNQLLEAQKALEPILSSAQTNANPVDPRSSSDLTIDFKETYGLSLYSNNYVVDAEPWLSMVASADPTRTAVLIPLAQAAILSRNYAEAWKYLDRASKIGSRDRTWLVLKSQYALENSRQSDAERFARSAVQYYPKDPVAIASLILALQKSRDDARHLEALNLANVVLEMVGVEDPSLTPLECARRAQSKNVALQYLIRENSARQNWSDAAKYLQIASDVPLDNAMVSTILRKSGNTVAAIQFATNWYMQDPTSEQAIEAYLRSLAMATGGLLASAQRTSDVPAGLGLALSAAGFGASTGNSSEVLNLVLTFIAAPFSKELKSFLYYMSASLQKDKSNAIEQLKDSLAERADNVEALVSLSSLYLERYQSQIDKSDTTNRDKALRYLTQAKSLNPTDKDILATIAQLEARLK